MQPLQLAHLDLRPLPIQRPIPSHSPMDSLHMIQQKVRRLGLGPAAWTPNALESAEDFAGLDDRVAMWTVCEARSILGETRQSCIGGVGGLHELSAV